MNVATSNYFNSSITSDHIEMMTHRDRDEGHFHLIQISHLTGAMLPVWKVDGNVIYFAAVFLDEEFLVS